MKIGGIEGGGTKFVCAVGNENGEVLDKTTFPTTDPDETFDKVKAFFKKHDIGSIGMASFGPVDLDVKSKTYGRVLNTPKLKWKNYDILSRLKEDFDVPIALDTDVNAACLGEVLYGAARDTDSALYMTVGTGIGVGFVYHGQPFRVTTHSEMGHVFIKQDVDDDFTGACPYHGNCLEGLAAGPAIEKRYGVEGKALQDRDEVWELEAYYLAQGIINFYLTLPVERIIIGGGVMKQEKLYRLIREKVTTMLNEYMIIEDIETLITQPALDDEQGVKGAMALVDVK